MLTVFGLFQKNTKITRYIALLAQTLWLIYAALIFNLTAVFSNTFQIISALIGITRAFFFAKKSKSTLTTEDTAKGKNAV